jgi:hypothetical protein
MANRRANEGLKKQGKASRSTSDGTKHCCNTLSATFNLFYFLVTLQPLLFKSCYFLITLQPLLITICIAGGRACGVFGGDRTPLKTVAPQMTEKEKVCVHVCVCVFACMCVHIFVCAGTNATGHVCKIMVRVCDYVRICLINLNCFYLTV